MTIVVAEHLSASLAERLATPYAGALIVADAHTRAALGEESVRRIVGATKGSLHLLDAPKATLVQAEALAKACAHMPCAIAIGSGTINDLVKYAAHRAGIPYAIIATAPSMNGYLSPTASLGEAGQKTSHSATAPTALYADLSVLARAPARMRAAGMGDTLCRSTVQTDWRLAHVLRGTPYDDAYFAELLPLEHELIAHAAGVASGDTGIIRLLFEALLEAGRAMAMHGSSMPASQGEHMIAHTMEMLGAQTDALHGEQIAVTTLTMARMQERMLLPPEEEPALHTLESLSRETREWIGAMRVAPEILEQSLLAAGCPTRPEQIGWNADTYAHAIRIAPTTRDRFTFLNIEVSGSGGRVSKAGSVLS